MSSRFEEQDPLFDKLSEMLGSRTNYPIRSSQPMKNCRKIMASQLRMSQYGLRRLRRICLMPASQASRQNYGQSATDVAVRSSATAEDLPDASFAGQQETFLNVRGPAALIDAVRNCFSSLFTDRAISYRKTFNFDVSTVGLSVCVQKMVRSDLASSGVAFSLDTESGFREVVMINGAFGLGEMVVQGALSPDEFLVFKPTRQQGFPSIIEKRLGVKDKMMVYGDHSDERTRVIPVEPWQQHRFCLDDKHILELADLVM